LTQSVTRTQKREKLQKLCGESGTTAYCIDDCYNFLASNTYARLMKEDNNERAAAYGKNQNLVAFSLSLSLSRTRVKNFIII
jgi:hypothetical protein